MFFSIGFSSNDDFGWVVALLTPEEAAKINEIKKQGPTGPISTGFYSTGNLGYIDPKKISGYFVRELNRGFKGPPKLSVYIDFTDMRMGTLIGNYCFLHEEDGTEYPFLGGPILEGDDIDVQYISEDNSGHFIPITSERINKEIREIYNQIDGGVER